MNFNFQEMFNKIKQQLPNPEKIKEMLNSKLTTSPSIIISIIRTHPIRITIRNTIHIYSCIYSCNNWWI